MNQHVKHCPFGSGPYGMAPGLECPGCAAINAALADNAAALATAEAERDEAREMHRQCMESHGSTFGADWSNWRASEAEAGRLTGMLDEARRGLRQYQNAWDLAVAEKHAAVEEAGRLRAALGWALGEEGEFGPRPKDAGAYWWRTELRRRALLPPSQPPSGAGA